MPPPIARVARLRADLDLLADRASGASFALAGPERGQRVALRDELVRVTRGYLIDRLGDLDAPLLVTVVGPTGSGKSTLVNSLAGRAVSKPGPLRPTTRRPVVWCHVSQAGGYESIAGVETDVVAEDHPLLTDMTLVDTPDLDSYVTDHRRMTERILNSTDVVVFVTSAQRYADAVPWEILAEIERRGSVVVFVMNRLSRRSSGAVSDYMALLRSHGFAPDTIHEIQEQRVRGEEGVLPDKTVRNVKSHLTGLAADRDSVLISVTRNATAHAVAMARRLGDSLREQDSVQRQLLAVVDGAYRDALEEVVSELDRGSLIRAEVVERWAERVGTGEVARWARGSASWVRSLAARLGGQPLSAAKELEREARSELTRAVNTRLERAARAVARGWELEPAGSELVTEDMRVPGVDTLADAEAAIDRWLAGLTRMVEDAAPGRFRTARVASTGLNAAAVASILALFASTGGITGAEFGVAAGAAAAQQGILEHLLGRAAAQSLSGSARDSLVAELKSVFGTDAERFRAVLAAAGDPSELADELDEAAATVEREAEMFYGG